MQENHETTERLQGRAQELMKRVHEVLVGEHRWKQERVKEGTRWRYHNVKVAYSDEERLQDDTYVVRRDKEGSYITTYTFQELAEALAQVLQEEA